MARFAGPPESRGCRAGRPDGLKVLLRVAPRAGAHEPGNDRISQETAPNRGLLGTVSITLRVLFWPTFGGERKREEQGCDLSALVA